MNSWLHLLQALLMGCGLGLVYGFLQPLRPRWFSDLLFLWVLFAAWFYLGFALCGGDLRFAYSASLVAGLCLWNFTFGQWLHPVFSGFWKSFWGLVYLISLPFKKTYGKMRKIRNFLFATGKKWVTIKCKKHPPGTGTDD